jgi:MOB kinase activator 1
MPRVRPQQIYKKLFRLYAHIYYSHFEKIRSIGANAHLNTCFKHFVYFVQVRALRSVVGARLSASGVLQEFQLVDDEEMAPLAKLIDKFKKE